MLTRTPACPPPCAPTHAWNPTAPCTAAFPFFYIEPGKPDFQHITMKFTGKMKKRQLDEIAPIGNSPTFIVRNGCGKVWKGCER